MVRRNSLEYCVGYTQQRRLAPTTWPRSSGMSGRDHVESAAAFDWNHRPESMEYTDVARRAEQTQMGDFYTIIKVVLTYTG